MPPTAKTSGWVLKKNKVRSLHVPSTPIPPTPVPPTHAPPRTPTHPHAPPLQVRELLNPIDQGEGEEKHEAQEEHFQFLKLPPKKQEAILKQKVSRGGGRGLGVRGQGLPG